MSNEVMLLRPWGDITQLKAAAERLFEDSFVSIMTQRMQKVGLAVEAIPYGHKGAKGVHTTRILINDYLCSLHRLKRPICLKRPYKDRVYNISYWQVQFVFNTLRSVDRVVICTAQGDVLVCKSDFLLGAVFGPQPNTHRRSAYWPVEDPYWADSLGRDLLNSRDAFHLLKRETQRKVA